jgi:Family of unknown function (DUF6502)
MTQSSDVMTQALIQVFRPLVRLLLKFQIPYKACADALRWTYVDIATREFSLGVKAQTKTRVAVITGLTRLEVEKLQREGARTTKETAYVYNRAARVVSAWENTQGYQKNGKPIRLALDGNQSISDLVTRYSGGATVRAVLDELISKGNVRKTETNEFELVQAGVLVGEDVSAELDIMAQAASDLLSTIEHNIRPNQTDRWMQAYTEQRDFPEAHLAQVRALVKKRGNELIDELDALLLKLSETKAPATASDAVIPRLGLGLYFFQDRPPIESVAMDTRGRRSKKDSI